MEVEQMLLDLSNAIAQALAAGKTPREAARIGDVLIRRKYRGERLYIAKLPRAQHAYELSAMGAEAATTRQAEQALCLSERQVRRIGRLRSG